MRTGFLEAEITCEGNSESFTATLHGFNNTHAYTPLLPDQLAGNSSSANTLLDGFILPGETIVAPTIPALAILFSYTSGYTATETLDCSFRFGDYVVSYSVIVEFSDTSPSIVVTDGEVGCRLRCYDITDITDVGNDQGRQVRITWNSSTHDVPGDPDQVTGYAVFRRQDEFKCSELNGPAPISSSPEFGSPRLSGWDYLATVPAFTDDEYQYVASTLCDSTESGICWSTFMIRAITRIPDIFFETDPDSGYSIDNLVPEAPVFLSADYMVSGVALEWSDAPEADFRLYRIYREEEAEFTPSPDNLIHETSISDWTDPTVNPWDYFYKITVVDFAGNESDAAVPTQISSVQSGAVPFRTILHEGAPNPFNPATQLSFEMAIPGHARLKVYDAAGRLVATLMDEYRDPGIHQTMWNGKNSEGRMSSAGVYLVLLEVGDFRATKRLVLLK